MSIEAISQRVVSSINVSVGTSIALETILPTWPVFDPERKRPAPVQIRDYTKLYINISTLGRNFFNAIPRELRSGFKGDIVGQALCDEALEIERFVREYTSGTVAVGFYYCSYKGVQSLYPKGKIRKAHTPIQLAFQKEHDKMVEYAIKAIKADHPHLIEEFDVNIRPSASGNFLLMTHYPIDLLSEYRMGKCDLLESHTGALKKKNMWYTKLFNGKELSMIPFNAMTLQIFGDDSLFHPWSPSIKNALINLANKNRWSWATTSAKIRLDLNQITDTIFVQAVRALL